MTQNQGQPGQPKSSPPGAAPFTAKAVAADALDAMARGELASEPTSESPGAVVDGIEITVAPSGAPPADLILAAGGTPEQAEAAAAGESAAGMASPAQPGQVGQPGQLGQPGDPVDPQAFPEMPNPFTLAAQGAPKRKRRGQLSANWQYAIPALAAMATAMFLVAAVVIYRLATGGGASTSIGVVMLVAALLLGAFLLLSCFVIHKELARQRQQRADRDRKNLTGPY